MECTAKNNEVIIAFGGLILRLGRKGKRGETAGKNGVKPLSLIRYYFFII